MFIFYIGSIRLNFRRTISSTRRCTFPDCTTPIDRLRGVKRVDRFKALKTKKIYIPFGAKFCANHVFEDNWQVDMNRETIFTKSQLEDLINLFYCSSQDTDSSGWHFFKTTFQDGYWQFDITLRVMNAIFITSLQLAHIIKTL